ncbi:MAG: preprotein translocase subunit SecA [Clostridia bacterium]|nr:preprotein translocase subunit SecA [Clostridia bacterium]
MGFLDNMMSNRYNRKEIKRAQAFTDRALALADRFSAMSEAELKGMTAQFKQRIANGEELDSILPEAFATVAEASWRVLNMRHYPVQMIGGVVLHKGKIAEMKTGEGKTLVATLPAYLNALTGNGVHIVTVNDYLAKRDSEWMGKVYRYLGLSVGLVIHDVDPAERRPMYEADITYGTNNEMGFDYLRDNMVTYKERMVQRGHSYAIVDEVDSILVDEARTPLIISGPGDKSTELYQLADRVAQTLHAERFVELSDKENHDDIDADYIIDEKARTATLTPRGVEKVERAFNIDNLNDPENMTLSHHINQAIRARGIMKRDVDYVVKDGEVIIVDEFTGRLMYGRRYNEGLHQAIEAKEGVTVAKESKTLATITFQNYFRLYDKLAGMTGTAMTEAAEFREIYDLDVVEIPTNKPMIRDDKPDVVYKTEAAKYNAVIEQISECHEKGQPVLVGTVTIEKSELLSKMLKRQGIQHQVLNAKHHEKEAEIVAQAGKLGAVTIATNMAGRGTDIMLGGNAEYLAKARMRKEQVPEELIVEATGYAETEDPDILGARAKFREYYDEYRAETAKEAEQVVKAGGLFIVGTERHESRRIDNQLRGRSGRQGDPGASRFFLSAEDELVRLFGGDRIKATLEMLRVDENMPIESKMLSNVIESSQKRVESRNFSIRKSVLQYDDVMNRQREIIYDQRGKVLAGEDIHPFIEKMKEDTINAVCDMYLGGNIPDEWNLMGLRDHYLGVLTDENTFNYTREELQELDRKDVINELMRRADEKMESQREIFGEMFPELERIALLRSVDSRWMDHIDAMEDLKRGIYLRSYGQQDPVNAYKQEGFDMFDEMIEAIKEDTIKRVLAAKIVRQEKMVREQIANPIHSSHGGDGSVKKQPVVKKKKIGPNDPCPCGSGKKYKNCCG